MKQGARRNAQVERKRNNRNNNNAPRDGGFEIKSLVAFCFGLDFDFKGVFLSEEGDVKSDRTPGFFVLG